MGSPAEPVIGMRRALTIAGSDSGGGAGIQADLKVFFALGCHGMSAVTALTAQNTVEVAAIELVAPAFVTAQIDAVVTDIGIDAAKTGMLASAEIVEAVANAVSTYHVDRLVVDPVFVSKHRDRLLAEDAIGALKMKLFPLAMVITPNLYEAGALLGGGDIASIDDMKKAAPELGALGPRSVLLKGGHLPGAEAVDIFWDGESCREISGPRYDTDDTHGTGCALSAAIAAFLARGAELSSAIDGGKRFVSGAIRRSIRLGRGFGPVNPGWAITEET
ncbi:MAG: hydroxymethylpyrimidine/phosphomethylpyrimidine kinase [Actinomycetota bacterium]|nr:hydroxymethylpyrimidine/phosphomethylpyrimidine kinase [Actinomycetota bacterium]